MSRSKRKMKSKITKAYRNIINGLRFLSTIRFRFHRCIDSLKMGVTKPQVIAYKVVGGRAAMAFPLFKDLDTNLRKSGIKVNFKAYVSTVILVSLLASVWIPILVTLLLILAFNISLLPSLLFGVGAGLLAGASTVIGFYIYPIYRADSLKRGLEDGLPFTTGYMSILSGTGVPPDSIFRSLAQVDSSLAISNEARTIIRDVELFGYDVISALEAACHRTPSERFKDLLEGLIATIRSGGSLAKYLRDRSIQYMNFKRVALTRFSNTLSVLAEFYVTLIVAGPLIFVVMLAVMAMLGGGESGLLNPHLLLYLLTYIGIPIGSLIFLTILDAISPKR